MLKTLALPYDIFERALEKPYRNMGENMWAHTDTNLSSWLNLSKVGCKVPQCHTLLLLCLLISIFQVLIVVTFLGTSFAVFISLWSTLNYGHFSSSGKLKMLLAEPRNSEFFSVCAWSICRSSVKIPVYSHVMTLSCWKTILRQCISFSLSAPCCLFSAWVTFLC